MEGERVVRDPAKPFWIDELVPKHEAYYYGESDARMVIVPVNGRSVDLIVPEYVPEFEPSFVRMADDTLLVSGVMIPDEEDEEDWNEEGYGILLVARRCTDREAAFWTVIAHELFPETMGVLNEPRRIGPASQPTPEDIAIPTPPSGGNDG